MPEGFSIESTYASMGIYNPGSLAPELLLEEFIARKRQLGVVLNMVRNSESSQSPQHLLVLGPRGIGKTMLLLALAYSVQREAELSSEWIPIIFPEETYGIGDLADFWLSTTGHLLETMGKESAATEIESLRDKNPEDIEERARALFLKHLATSGKRALIVLENLEDFFAAVSDEAEQHRLRAFLMQDDRVMIAASSPTYFDATGQIDQPFYDFFRIIRLERFDREEMIEVLRELARVRKSDEVEMVIREQPERIDSLRVLTGGNPRLVKMIYRLLDEGGSGSARQDFERLLEDCTPYFKHRIEELSREERRVFDHVARHWDPVAVGDVQRALRRPSNKVSIYLRRLVSQGFIEEAEGSTAKRKAYQVAERFYNIYYLMRFSRSGKRRLAWLVQAMRVLYSPEDFQAWTERTLQKWRDNANPRDRQYREAFLYSLTKASDDVGLQRDLVGKTITAAWEEDQLACLDQLLDKELGKQVLGAEFDLITYFSSLSSEEKERLGYEPDNARWWYQLTDPLMENAHYGLAEHAYGKAIELDPAYASPWHDRGVVLMDHLGRHEEAEIAFRKAIELDPTYADPWNGLGVFLTDHLGQYEEAVVAYRKAIELDPKDAYSWNNLGVVLTVHLGRHEEAEYAFRKAIDLDPAYAYPWHGLGNVLKSNFGRHEGAEEAYRRAIELDPKYAHPWYGLGNVLTLHLGRHEEAVVAYRKAIELDPKDAYPWASLSNALAKTDRAEEARAVALQGAMLDCKIGWARNQFLKHCSQDSSSWLALLPSLLAQLPSSQQSTDSPMLEMALRGLEFVLGQDALTTAEAIRLITEAGAEECLADILLALRSMDDPSVLTKASPERRAFAQDFLKRIFGSSEK